MPLMPLSCTVPDCRLPLGISSRDTLLLHCNLISLRSSVCVCVCVCVCVISPLKHL